MKNKSEKTLFFCNNCGNEFSTWSGKCSSCGEWNSIKEVKESSTVNITNSEKIVPKKLNDLTSSIKTRIKTGYSEIDRVFGGGIVSGSVVLFGGEPGIGKSTLLLQIAANLANNIYLSGEESAEQINIRADRLKISTDKINFSTISDISNIEQMIIESSPEIIIIDSIQTVYVNSISGTAGSQNQVRECGILLQRLAKKYSVVIIIIGHVTKEGVVAGPRILEHLVDVVVYIEGDRNHEARIVRAVKNRFGATDEIAVLTMGETGLIEVKNPSAIFLSESENVAGSATAVLLEGSRSLLVEIQALVTPTVFGYPRRTSSGFDLNRLNLLIGVLIKRTGLSLGNQDIYLSVVGGISTSEPAADLAVCMAIASSYKNKSLKEKIAFFGEVGLTGEIRKVAGSDKRKKEAENLGYKIASDLKNINDIIMKYLA